jgi:hypothetical protein
MADIDNADVSKPNGSDRNNNAMDNVLPFVRGRSKHPPFVHDGGGIDDD